MRSTTTTPKVQGSDETLLYHHTNDASILTPSPCLRAAAAASSLVALLRGEWEECGVVAFLWPGQAQLWRTRGLCHSALMVASAPAARSDSTESSCLSVAVRIPGAVLDHIIPSTVFSQNGSACWGFDVCIAAEDKPSRLYAAVHHSTQLQSRQRLTFAY